MEINTIRLRKMLGWLGIFLPWIVALLLLMIPQSISSTYYTYQAGPVFMIILGSSCLLLISYKGYDKFDDILNTFAGIFGLGICLFPCWNDNLEKVGTFQLPNNISSKVHAGCAILFFILLAYNSLFRFTKHGKIMTKRKKIRNIIYIICGIGMLLSFCILLLPSFRIRIWLVETIALFFFGISFLTKANCYKFLACDEKIGV